jgi:hypothetical protein
MNVVLPIENVIEDINTTGDQRESRRCHQHPLQHARLAPGIGEQRAHQHETVLDPLPWAHQAPAVCQQVHDFLRSQISDLGS